MNFSQYFLDNPRIPRTIRELEVEEAHKLFSAMLDGGLDDLHMGIWLMAFAAKEPAMTELLGFQSALTERLISLKLAARDASPIVIPSYGGAGQQANLMPLLALLLQRFGIPVLIHGSLQGNGRVAGAYVLRELGILPSITQGQAEQALNNDGIAFVPTAVIAPGVAALLSLCNRLGLPNPAQLMARLLQPLACEAVCLTPLLPHDNETLLGEFVSNIRCKALVFLGTEGEAFVDPTRRPQITLYQEGERQILFKPEVEALKRVPGLPALHDAISTARWVRSVIAGESPLPIPLVNQLACCLYATGYAPDMNQAKAIVAVETGSLAA